MAAITRETQLALRNKIEINFGHLLSFDLEGCADIAAELHVDCQQYMGNAQILTEGTKELVDIK